MAKIDNNKPVMVHIDGWTFEVDGEQVEVDLTPNEAELDIELQQWWLDNMHNIEPIVIEVQYEVAPYGLEILHLWSRLDLWGWL